MELLVLVAIAIGIFLITLLKKKRPLGQAVETREWWDRMESDIHSRRLINLEFDSFQSLCVQLIESLGFEIVGLQSESRHEVVLIARNDQPLMGGDYLVLLFLQEKGGGAVPFEKVFDLKSTVRAQGALKGIFLTNTYFPREVVDSDEGAVVDIIDGIALGALLGEHAIL